MLRNLVVDAMASLRRASAVELRVSGHRSADDCLLPRAAVACLRRVAGVLAVGALCAVGVAATAQAVIVYRCAPDLCRINGDGTGQAQLTSDGATAAYHGASLSQDGTRMALTRDTEDLFIADGNAQNPAGPLNRFATVAKISFDGTMVAYEEDYTILGFGFSLCTKPTTGSTEQTCSGTEVGFPAWTPTGQIVASKRESGIDLICVYLVAEIGGCQRTVATEAPNNLEESAVSPDGSTLAVISVPPGSPTLAGGHLVLYDMASGALIRTLTSGTSDESPAWSPDGTHIVFARSGALFVIAAAGSPGSEHQIVSGGDTPTWAGSEAAISGGGGTTGGGGGTTGGGAATPQPPAVTAASLTNRRFRVAGKDTAVSAKKAPLGTTFRFTLSATANVQVAITRSAPGLRRGHSCVAPTATLRRAHAKHCTRTLAFGTLTRSSEPIGADSIAFSGRIGHRALSPGAYNAALSASDAGGGSKPVTLAFAVVR